METRVFFLRPNGNDLPSRVSWEMPVWIQLVNFPSTINYKQNCRTHVIQIGCSWQDSVIGGTLQTFCVHKYGHNYNFVLVSFNLYHRKLKRYIYLGFQWYLTSIYDSQIITVSWKLKIKIHLSSFHWQIATVNNVESINVLQFRDIPRHLFGDIHMLK